MFALVNDIESYPQFLPGCIGAEIFERGEGYLSARLDLRTAGLNQSFATKNLLDPPNEMRLTLEDGPFSFFEGVWSFQSLSESACKITFSLRYEFSNKLLGLAAGKVFEKVSTDQVDAMCKRAREIYS